MIQEISPNGRITEAEISASVDALRTDGVVLLRNAVPEATLEQVTSMVSSWYDRFLDGSVENYSLDDETATIVPDLWGDAFTKSRTEQSFRKWNVAGLDERIIPAVDAEPLYPVIHRFIGPDLMVSKTQMIVVPSHCSDSPYLHTDAGSMSDIVEDLVASPVMVSAQIFLTDLPEPGMGNFACVPGSHTRRFPWEADNPYRSQLSTTPLGTAIDPDSREFVCARAGDAAIFMHSLWHGVSPNTSQYSRQSVILSYAKSFVRPYDYEATPANVLESGTARQRLLFGDLEGWAYRPGCYYHLPENYLKALEPDALTS